MKQYKKKNYEVPQLCACVCEGAYVKQQMEMKAIHPGEQ